MAVTAPRSGALNARCDSRSLWPVWREPIQKSDTAGSRGRWRRRTPSPGGQVRVVEGGAAGRVRALDRDVVDHRCSVSRREARLARSGTVPTPVSSVGSGDGTVALG